MTDALKLMMVEDSPSLAAIYNAYLAEESYQTVTVDSLGRAHATLDAFVPDLILLDIELPDGNGIDFLRHVMELEKPPKVVVMTAHGTSDMAVDAIRMGASDFLTKPFDAARLKVTLGNAAAQLDLGKRIEELSGKQRASYANFIGASNAMQTVYQTIDSLAPSDATGFIVGESGTGKELAAEAIHAHSDRAGREFVAINCGAIPGELMESELFGHVKGAFTGASNAREGAASIANGGTLFLDEICEMDLELQKKLLRFIQTGTFRKVGSNTLETVDVRFVCATNRDPLVEVREGRFREDLFYRLHVVPLRLPPLRERDRDILMIARHFLEVYADQAKKAFTHFSLAAEEQMLRYVWPGNVRQLQNVIQQAVVLHDGEQIEADMLALDIHQGLQESLDGHDSPGASAAKSETHSQPDDLARRRAIEPLWMVEKRAIEAAVAACDGNINRAAGLLEVAPSTLYRKRQAWIDDSA
ncbi:sigma-54-dependent transcriptional regulator [Congregibacter litoralis]|uniref:Response regulator n=1 Tax=Congregibacter litoralis KT71 TaxID=314285 RepID=A4AB83_9GAMM|nr:sigma-54 dependent transcriptional regulator [Congregibacter litoralis]EAQ96637.1 Response regulator [Congregibacter litoralis KT71]